MARPLRLLTAVVLGLLLLGAVTTGLDVVVFSPRLHDTWHELTLLHSSEQAMVDQETALRAYLLAPAPADQEFLVRYRQGEATDRGVAGGLRTLRVMPELRRALSTRDQAIQAWHDGFTRSALGEATGKVTSEVFLAQGQQLFDTYRAADDEVQLLLSRQVTLLLTGQRAVGRAAAALGLVVVVVALLAVRHTRRRLLDAVARPISDVAAAVRGGAEGDLVPHLPSAAIRELDQLAGDVDALFSSLRERDAALQARAHELEVLGVASRALLVDGDPRNAICRAAAQITGAEMTFLFEPDGAGHLVDVATFGCPPGQLVLEMQGEPALAVDVYLSRQAVFVEDVHRDPRVSRRLLDGRPPTGGAWLPVMADARCLGVLAVGLPRALGAMSPSLPAALEVLADAAAAAIERADMHDTLARQARVDGLTGVSNRRAWEMEFPDEVARAARCGQPLAVAMLDLDHFKAFNDTRGHQAGDELLRTAAQRWAARLRADDLLARYGGEEFALAVPGCDLADAVTLIEDLRRLLPDGQTCSAGVTLWDGVEPAEHALARADAALYRAKAAGRDQVVAGLAPARAGTTA